MIAGFRPEFERLLLTVLMEPWDMPREPAIVERELAARGKRSRRKRRAAGRGRETRLSQSSSSAFAASTSRRSIASSGFCFAASA